jgi:hypothetical protein
MVATIVFYFVAAPMLRRLRGFEPFSPQAVRSRRVAVLDHIAAALFTDREEGLRLAAQLAESEASPTAIPQPATHHRVAARRTK